ncbi:MAG: dTDP-glucose 4,6-dehydratase [Candidatus Omnitrophica bacterium]|jgi:dTDP-glucose 4,6-dehydratase|nr:dTDP-glucose 4,6-dehydratase [Candidatus Omnitrophota bacterium]
MHKLLVTGGAGFIGSEFVRQAVKRSYKVIVVDKLTYAGDLERLNEVKGKFKFYKVDICNKNKIGQVIKREKPQVIINFAAETHVDRSIVSSDPFIQTNIKGTKTLLDLAREYKIERFIHISTDEVYGDIEKGKFREDFPLKPNSPYAASKAAADLLIKAYVRTYNLPAIIVRPSNNYGPWQYPEKLIPLVSLRALNNQKVPVYARGQNIREWLYVSDCAKAIMLILENGKLGEVYNLGSAQEKKNIDVVKSILRILNKPESLIEFVADRPGHDFRYSLDFAKIRKQTGWCAQIGFQDGISKTVNWILDNPKWMKKHIGKKLSIKFK